MAQYRSAMGKTLNLESLKAKNENVRAVGNMKVNARGDAIDAFGNVIERRTQYVENIYNKSTGNPGAQSATPVQADPPSQQTMAPPPVQQPVPVPQPHQTMAPEPLLADEHELFEDDFVRDDVEIVEQPKKSKKK